MAAREEDLVVRLKLAPQVARQLAVLRDRCEQVQSDGIDAESAFPFDSLETLKRQIEGHEAEVRKRDKWLDKAKDIIKGYQKRHAPGASTPSK